MRRLITALLALSVFATAILGALTPLIVSAASPNLISNPSVETASQNTPDGWVQGGWGTNTRSLTLSKVAHSGTYGLQTTISSFTDGDAKWYFSPVTVTPGATYDFSDYYMATVSSTLVAQFDNGTSYSYQWLKDLPTASTWQQASSSLTVPAGMQHVTVFHLLSQAGSLTTDDYSLSLGSQVSAPTISITSPAAGSTVNGVVQINANASDSTGVASVQFKIDGVNLGAADTASPYQTSWDTTAFSQGSHSITAVVSNTQGTTATSSAVVVSVNNTVVAGDGNIVPNPSFETANNTLPQGWFSSSWGVNTPVFTYATNGHTGSRSSKVQLTSYSSGDAKWVFAPQAVTAGKKYNFSDYYIATVATDVVAQFDDGNGNYTYQDVGTAASSTSWAQFLSTITVPSGAKNMTVFHLINKVGTLQVDDFSLSEDKTLPTSNMVPNPSAETANGTQPQGWTSSSWGTNTTTFTYAKSGAHTGSKALTVQIKSYTDGDAKWVFPSQTASESKQYTFSDYYKSNADTYVIAAFDLTDGSTVYYSLGTASNSKNAWTQFSTTFSVPHNAATVTVFHLIRSVGTLTTDDYSMQEFVPVGFNRALVSITFDDGIDSIYNNGIPIVEKYGFRSTQYIISGMLGQSGYMTQDMVKKMSTSGHEIGSHTVSHPDLTTLTSTKLTKELSQSQTTLQQLTGSPIKDFASPYGSVNDKVLTEIKKYYTSHRGVEYGYNAKNNINLYDLKVQDVDAYTSVADLNSWLAQANATHTWLILVFHAVDPNTATAGQYSVTPANLDSMMASLKASGLTVKTMSDALSEITAQL